MIPRGTFDTMAIERVVFGRPCEDVVGEEAERLSAERVFLIVSRTLDLETDQIEKVRRSLGSRYAGQVSGIPAHTPREAVVEASRQAAEAGADLIVTYGGGSVTDAGKMVQLCLQHRIRDVDRLDDFREVVKADGTRITPEFEGPRVRQIAIPTTLSGGEFGMGAGCTDSRHRVKQLYRHPLFVPRVVVLDPRASLRTPEWLWLSTGVRALDHAVETLCSQYGTPQSDGPARHAITLLGRSLPQSRAAPDDLEARLECQLGAWASMDHHQCRVPMGASHGIGHVLGGTCDVPHGYTSCILLPHVLRFNHEVNGDRQAAVSEAMGKPDEDAADLVRNFVQGLGLPTRLSEVGVGRDRFREIAEKSLLDRYIHTNPKKIGLSDVLTILEMAA